MNADSKSSVPAATDDQTHQLAQQLYPQLRRIAHSIRNSLGGGETLRTTALVNEAFLKLARGSDWNDESHFMSAAAMAMRQIIVDDARARLAQRRGGDANHVSLQEADIGEPTEAAHNELLDVAVGDALKKLAALNPRLAQVVECRYFAGFTVSDTALALGVTERTVYRDWLKARGWLYRELKVGTD